VTGTGHIIRKKPAGPATFPELFATTGRGMEDILAAEMERVGLKGVRAERGGVRFSGGMEACLRANLHLRTATRVLVPLATFSCASPEELYEGVKAIPWWDYLTPDMTLAVDCSLRDSSITHSRYAALKAKDAVVDLLRERGGRRPNVDTVSPDLRINLHLVADRCTVSLDSSGEPLDRRGYRLDRTEAPLRETLAAALVELTGWVGDGPFIDPLCGSGTLVIEAAQKGAGIAPGLLRSSFGFQRWRHYDAALWKSLLLEAEAEIRPSCPFPVMGSDRDPAAIAAALHNARRARVDSIVDFQRADMDQVVPPAGPGVVILNPPYGERLGRKEDLVPFYRAIGDLLKQRFTGYTAFVFTGDMELAKQVGLKASRRHVLFNGPIECRLLQYELYK
jgi:putative N6-adenine-specific DNA methylase